MAIGLFDMDGGASIKPKFDLTAPLFDKITIQLHPAWPHPTIEHKNQARGVAAPGTPTSPSASHPTCRPCLRSFLTFEALAK